MFIVASSSEHLYNLYQDKLVNPGDKPEILLENVHPEAFERVLKFMYTGSCDVAELGPCGLKVKKEDVKKEKEEPIEEVESEVIGKW